MENLNRVSNENAPDNHCIQFSPDAFISALQASDSRFSTASRPSILKNQLSRIGFRKVWGATQC